MLIRYISAIFQCRIWSIIINNCCDPVQGLERPRDMYTYKVINKKSPGKAMVNIKINTARMVKSPCIMTETLWNSVTILSLPCALNVKNGNDKDRNKNIKAVSEKAITRLRAFRWFAVSVSLHRGQLALLPSGGVMRVTGKSHSTQMICLPILIRYENNLFLLLVYCVCCCSIIDYSLNT